MASSVDESRRWLQRAEKTSQAASALLTISHYPDAVSRAYYAMFYAAKAAILNEGVDVRKHSAVISAFGRLFTKTGRLPASLHQDLIATFDRRQGADYSLARETTREDAETTVAGAEEFVGAVAKMLDQLS